jgi:hypothetical protein
MYDTMTSTYYHGHGETRFWKVEDTNGDGTIDLVWMLPNALGTSKESMILVNDEGLIDHNYGTHPRVYTSWGSHASYQWGGR